MGHVAAQNVKPAEVAAAQRKNLAHLVAVMH
jgi:hypothetical protein